MYYTRSGSVPPPASKQFVGKFTRCGCLMCEGSPSHHFFSFLHVRPDVCDRITKSFRTSLGWTKLYGMRVFPEPPHVINGVFRAKVPFKDLAMALGAYLAQSFAHFADVRNIRAVNPEILNMEALTESQLFNLCTQFFFFFLFFSKNAKFPWLY